MKKIIIYLALAVLVVISFLRVIKHAYLLMANNWQVQKIPSYLEDSEYYQKYNEINL